MAFIIEDRVRDTSISTGVGPTSFAVSGTAPTRYRTLSAVLAVNDTFPYAIIHQSANEWELGLGTYTSANTFTRTTIYSSSNADAAVNFTAGTKDVFIAFPGTPAVASTIELGHPTDTTISRPSAGDIAIEGNIVYRAGGTDSTVADGGTGASTLTGLLQGNGTSPITGITNSSTVGQVLRVTGASTYAWGTVDLADTDAITGRMPFANLTQGTARSVLGITGNATADLASIQSSATGQLLNSTATAIAWTPTITLGASGTLGTITFGNATSGTILLTPATGALGSVTITMPATTGTIYVSGGTDVAVADGGTGAGTFTANGVLYGNTTSAIQVTAQGPANSILTANAGAPSFTASPTIGTQVTVPIVIGGTAASSTLDLRSTSGAGTSDFITFKTASQTERMRIASNGAVGIGATPGAQLTLGADTNIFTVFDATAYNGFNGIYNFNNTNGAAIGTQTAKTSGQKLSTFNFNGSDGVGSRNAASIDAVADATFTSGSSPGRLSFNTTPSASTTLAERMRISNAGLIYMPSIGTGTGTNIQCNTGSSPVNQLFVTTSSLRYKADVTEVSPERLEAIKDLRLIEYRSKSGNDDQTMRFVGLAAEEVAPLDRSLVTWGYDAEEDYDLVEGCQVLKSDAMLKPNAVMYERVLLLQVAALRREVEELKARAN
jgi:hypothetical protein